MALIDRRGFLRSAGATAIGGLAGARAVAADPAAELVAPAPSVRYLDLRNLHTGERLEIVFRDAIGYVDESLQKLSWLLRDHRVGESHEMDVGLFDQLAGLAATAGVAPRFEVISGYRSPRTNDRLVAAGRGVARQSLHMTGSAIDVRLEGVPSERLRDLALAAARGGVGYYARSDFVHLDTGRFRTWTG